MSRLWRRARLRSKLLLSYVVVVAVGVGALVLGATVVAPSLFDRLLAHMGGDAGMSQPMRRDLAAAFRTALIQALLVATAAALAAAVAVSLYVAHRVTAPVTRLAAASRRLARGDYRARVAVSTQDELGELATAFNDMAAALGDVERRRILLIGDVAHEVRTPLATLQGYLEGLSDGVVEPTPALWAQLRGETVRLSRLIEDLQELSAFEAGRVSLRRRAVSPARLIESATARLAIDCRAKDVDLRIVAASGLPPVLADEDRAVQILTNLLTNALRYTPAGGHVTVTAATSGDEVCFTVVDTGIGIAADHLPHLFDRFYRVDPARSRALGGSGVGLAIAKVLVEAHGGQIRAASLGPGRGATFAFTLPCVQDRDTTADQLS